MEPTLHPDVHAVVKDLQRELANFEDMAQYLMPQPGDLPTLAGIDAFGGTLALNGQVGGDHLIYVDFKQRFDLDTRMQRALDEGRHDVVMNLVMEVEEHLRVSFPPLGMLPSLDVIDRSRTTSPMGFKEHYETNEWQLMGRGDILLLCTDGLMEHDRADEAYVPGRLEPTLRAVKDQTASEIFEALRADLLAFGEPTRRHQPGGHQAHLTGLSSWVNRRDGLPNPHLEHGHPDR